MDRALTLSDWAITYVRTILQYGLNWFTRILGSMGLQYLWIGAVVFVIVFSVILLPMRGGSMLGGGMVSDMVRSRISSSRRNSNKHAED